MTEYLTQRSGVHVRSIMEPLLDHCSEDGDHTQCLMLWQAARWPNPAPGHSLKSDADLIAVMKRQLEE